MAHSAGLLVLLCATVSVINSLDRTAMSVAVLPMSAQYGWSSSVKGAIARCPIAHALHHMLARTHTEMVRLRDIAGLFASSGVHVQGSPRRAVHAVRRT
jgi:hypothetical protein